MKTQLMCALLLGCTSSAMAMNAKQACDELKPVVKELQQQTPVEVDYITSMTGVQALYAGGQCLLNYNYMIKTQGFLQDMQNENELSFEENLAFLKTEEGVATLQQSFDAVAAQSAQLNFKQLQDIKNLKVSYTYSFDDTSLSMIKAMLIDN